MKNPNSDTRPGANPSKGTRRSQSHNGRRTNRKASARKQKSSNAKATRPTRPKARTLKPAQNGGGLPTRAHLTGDPRKDADGGWRLNGHAILTLTQRQYSVVFTLALYSKMLVNDTGDLEPFARILKSDRHGPPIEPSAPSLSGKQTGLAIEKILLGHGLDNSPVLRLARDEGAIYKVVLAIRKRLKKAGFSRNLIETGDNGRGFRLNIEPEDLKVTVPKWQPRAMDPDISNRTAGQPEGLDPSPTNRWQRT